MSAEIKVIIDSYSDTESLVGANAELEKMIAHLREIAGYKKKGIGDSTGVSSYAKETAELKKLTLQIKSAQIELAKLKEEQDRLAEAKKKTTAATSEQIKDEIRYNATVQSQKKELKDQINLQNAKAGSIDYLRAKLSQVTKEYNALSGAERDQTATGKALAAQKLDLTNQLKKLEKATGDHRREVGNYGLAVAHLAHGLGGLSGLISTVGKAFGFETEQLQELTHISHAFVTAARNLHNVHTGEVEVEKDLSVAREENIAATEGETIAAEAQTAATEEQTVAQLELNESILANPYFLAVAGVTALAGAILAYVSISKEAKKAEEEMDTAVDGTIIKDKEARRSHNESIFTLQKLRVQYKLLTGSITEEGAALENLKIDTNKKLSQLNEDTNEKLKEQTGTWSKFVAGFTEITTLGYSNTVKNGKINSKELEEIQKDHGIKMSDIYTEERQEKLNIQIEYDRKEHEEQVKANNEAISQIRDLNNSIISSDFERSKAQLYESTERQLAEVEQLKATEKYKAELRKAINDKYYFDLEQLTKEHYIKLRDEINTLEDQITNDALGYYKERLKIQADNNKEYAALTITDAGELTNERIRIEDSYQDDIASIDKEALRLKEKRDAQAIRDEYGDTEHGNEMIALLEQKLKNDIQHIDDVAAENKLQATKDEFEALADEISSQNKELTDKAYNDQKGRDKLEAQRFKDNNELRLVLAKGAETKRQAQISNIMLEQGKELDDLENERRTNKLLTEEEYETKRQLIIAKSNAEIKKLEKESQNERIAQLKQFGDKVLDAATDKSKREQDALEKQVSDQNSEIEYQRQRAIAGQENDLVQAEKRKAELEKAAIAEQKRQQKIKQAQIYWDLFAKFAASDGTGDDARKAALELAEGIAISAAFAEKGGMGEDLKEVTKLTTDGFDKSHASGDILTMISPKEGILTEKEVQALGGKEGFYQLKYNLDAMAKNPIADDVFAQQNESFSKVAITSTPVINLKPLEEKVDRLSEIMENKPTPSWNVDALGNYIYKLHKKGSTVTTEKGSFVRPQRKKFIE
jgi:hypothetical protein